MSTVLAILRDAFRDAPCFAALLVADPFCALDRLLAVRVDVDFVDDFAIATNPS